MEPAMTPVPISRLAGNIEAWICPHAELREPIEDGEIILCDACSEALRSEPGKLVNGEDGMPFLKPFDLN
jgi:hypothetical protein